MFPILDSMAFKKKQKKLEEPIVPVEKSIVVFNKCMMTTEVTLPSLVVGSNRNSQPEEEPYVFYQPGKVLKIEDIFEELYNNPKRGKMKEVPIIGWSNLNFTNISKADLLSKPPQSSITAFNDEGYTLNSFEKLNNTDLAKMLEHL